MDDAVPTSPSPPPKIYLMGAGLGGVDALTVQGQRVLQQADVVFVDALVEESVVASLPPKAQVIRVGKRAGSPIPAPVVQADIHAQMIERYRAGQQVVRLKAGDPLIFGRALEEVAALQAAGCAFEILPGLSSALTAPLLAGIPLTHKTLSRCFAVLTAHDLDLLPWAELASLDTLVILMGSQPLPSLCQKLRQAGKPLDCPVAVIGQAGSPQQQVEIGSLHHPPTSLQPPSVIVVGSVVNFRPTLQPHLPPPPPTLPLRGKTVLVTRADSQSSPLRNLLHSQGARVLEMPTLEIVPPSDWRPLDQAILHLPRFTWLCLTSANAVRYFFERLHHHQRDSRALAGLKIMVVGTKTAATLAEYGLRADVIPHEFVADALVTALPNPHQQTILFPRVESGGRETLVQAWQALGAEVCEVAAYQSQCPTQADPPVIWALQQEQIDILTFASSKTVSHFWQLLQQAAADGDPWAWMKKPKIAAIGPKTAETCENLWGRVDIVADPYTLEALVAAIVQTCEPVAD
ncbi:MAG: uroporphyrinogen-III C-methyltransferase [Cyanobacteriota bacterium]|nr:uroporphyrinogen-III C-methyltransferase [Cyanobacteriota bacterium]